MIQNKIADIIAQQVGETLELKAVLPPSKHIAQLICSFANTEGGHIVLGVTDENEINGLSKDFHANTITHKALDLLSPQPKVSYQYTAYKAKKIYVIEIDKSEIPITLEGNVYKRVGNASTLVNPTEVIFQEGGYKRIKQINKKLNDYKKISTSAKSKLIEHYQSILKIVDDLGAQLYPINVKTSTNNQEGKILTRILFSSIVDNFETYLSDLLYEIFLANPSTLKSQQKITIEEVLNCSDLQEFIKYWAKQKIGKLQKGSVKGFISDNKQIRDLNIIDKVMQDKIEKILQIRHLYAHRNGIIDEKFLQYFTTGFSINSEHQMSIDEICDNLCYLADVINKIDLEARKKYKLA